MTANFDADSSSNWVEIFSNSYEAEYVQGKATQVYLPIPATEINVDIDSPLIAVYCSSTQYDDTEKFLGTVIQQVKLPSIFPVSHASGRGEALYNNRVVLAKFTEFDDSYSLLFKPKYYVETVSIKIYKYIGSTYFVIEERLNNLESKIDQVIENLGSGSTAKKVAEEQLAATIIIGTT